MKGAGFCGCCRLLHSKSPWQLYNSQAHWCLRKASATKESISPRQKIRASNWGERGEKKSAEWEKERGTEREGEHLVSTGSVHLPLFTHTLGQSITKFPPKYLWPRRKLMEAHGNHTYNKQEIWNFIFNPKLVQALCFPPYKRASFLLCNKTVATGMLLYSMLVLQYKNLQPLPFLSAMGHSNCRGKNLRIVRRDIPRLHQGLVGYPVYYTQRNQINKVKLNQPNNVSSRKPQWQVCPSGPAFPVFCAEERPRLFSVLFTAMKHFNTLFETLPAIWKGGFGGVYSQKRKWWKEETKFLGNGGSVLTTSHRDLSQGGLGCQQKRSKTGTRHRPCRVEGGTPRTVGRPIRAKARSEEVMASSVTPPQGGCELRRGSTCLHIISASICCYYYHHHSSGARLPPCWQSQPAGAELKTKQ